MLGRPWNGSWRLTTLWTKHRWWAVQGAVHATVSGAIRRAIHRSIQWPVPTALHGGLRQHPLSHGPI
ncbi:MAG: hypothetical protein EBR46_05480, partial [Betaproteobacteria bacterium]|nr:hypothetical protein [Betaproteobacteria bacterium]